MQFSAEFEDMDGLVQYDAGGNRRNGATSADEWPRSRKWFAWLLWSLAVGVGLIQAWAGLRRPLVDRLSDLQVYIGAIRLMHNDASLYDFASVSTAAPFTYPPFAAVILTPLTIIPLWAASLIWSMITIVAVGMLAVAVATKSELRGSGGRWLPAFVAIVLFASAPISSNLRFGQVSVFLVILVLLDALRIVPDRYVGVATGVAAAIKLTPLVFVPYMWLSGQRRAALTATGAFVVCTTVGWAVLPGESLRFWLDEIWNVERVGNLVSGGNQSLNGAMLRLGTPENVRVATVALVGGSVVVLAFVRAVRAVCNDRPLAGVVIVGAAGLVLSPVSWTHHQVWLVIAAFVAISDRPRRNVWWMFAVLCLMLLPVTAVSGNELINAIAGNARLWLAIAVACLVPFSATRKPMPPLTVYGSSALQGAPRRGVHGS